MTTPERHIGFENLLNFRDLGGYRTRGGRSVRWRRLYRADALSKLASGADWKVFDGLGIATVIDLRHGFEIEARGRIAERAGVAYHHCSIEHRPYDQPGQGPEVEPGPFLAERYREVAEDGVVEIRRALEVIADPASGPLVFHCASGKDRTGQLAATVLALLDVAESDIVADFALTDLAAERLRAHWTAEHGDGRPPRWPGYGYAPAEVMELFLAGLAKDYGSVRGYAEQRLGVDDDLVGRLRETLLDG
ncbi:tyrosine-protein phosphatase [Streptacidiphilus fuscans]|uniref:Tyrosine-protein phosphatase n=1 Tax=Streptacidiphilus fuscans TaxID=2789292 RepID=A0A931FC13_9ACTN|nr:tyrosine-protein phosphatase [Streptacidiphilus fuscans]MBF9067998.1 tyrosine-protein phosphatase [Streptacidiphilus fuscans]